VAESSPEDLEVAALALLCTQLSDLQAIAERDGWRSRLDTAIAALRGGHSAVRVCNRLGLDMDAAHLAAATGRTVTDPASLHNLGIDPIPMIGDYVCPQGRCIRHASPDANGYEPLCVDGTPMLLEPPV
jgi:hypothetical protein